MSFGKTLAVVGVLMFALMATFVLPLLGFYNTEATLRASYEAKTDANKADFDNVWKTISQVAQVPAQYKSDFADVFVAYAFDPTLVPHVFQEFRVDADTLTHTFVRNQVREAINRVAQTMPVIQIYGDGKAKITDTALLDLQKRLASRGFIFDALAFVGEMRVPDNVKASINKVITAQNEASEAEARVKQREFEAAQNVALAQGDFDAAVLRAKANRELAASVTPELVQYMNAMALQEKWDGKLPTFAGGNGIPLIQLPNK